MRQASERTIERISMYRRLLRAAQRAGQSSIYSHDLADMTGGTAVQVRRDLMELGCVGNSRKGYDVDHLIEHIGSVLDSPEGDPVALIGVGNLGRALLQFFASHHPKLKIVASFDADPRKTGRVIHGCRCHDISELADVVAEQGISVAILAVPSSAAATICDAVVSSGVKGILNFVPEPLKVPPEVTVENIDMTMALEKVAYLARVGR